MKIHNVIQGSQEWLDLRARYFTASEAPAMMGASPYMTRGELLRQKHTGIRPDLAAGKEALFAQGHEAEAAFRPIAESIIGDDLYPASGSIELDGLNLLASFDGLTMDFKQGFEHKLWNADLALSVETDGEPGPAYYWQMEQHLLVSGAERILFATSDGTSHNARHCFYASKPERRAALIAGWKQFAADLAAYTPAEAAAPAPAGVAPEMLPALYIRLKGEVSESNLAQFKDHALAVFAGIKRDLATDQDFADAEKTVKWCSEVESKLAAAKDHALSQTATIEALFRAIDEISETARRTRLDLEKLVKQRKEQIRTDIVNGGMQKLREHIDSLNETIGKPWMPDVPANFAEAVKNKRTLSSLQDAVDTELARTKIAANEIAGRIQVNLRTIQANTDLLFLFPDERMLALKAADDLAAVIAARIATHREAEQRKSTEKPAPIIEQVIVAPRPDTGTKIKLGDINARLAPISISADGLAELGIHSCGTDRAAKLYHEADFQRICAALLAHISSVREVVAA